MKIGKKLKKVCALALSCSMILSVMPNVGTETKVDAASFDYGLALKDGITFYDANKCGADAGEDNAFSWRGACHENDGSDVGLDLSGGYHDCGDHVKFGCTQVYAASILEWSYYSYKDSFTSSGSEEKTLQTLKHFCDYFLKCHPNMFTFYYQIGDAGSDHSYWGAPEDQGDRSTIYKVDSSNAGSDVCGGAAAALALMYLNYNSIDSEYAEECLASAKTIYALGKSNYGLSNGGGCYSPSDYKDDMAWGACWLYKVTGDSSYLTDAKNFMQSGSSVAATNWAMCWNDMNTPAALLLYQLTNESKYLDAVKYNINYWINDCPTTSGGLKYRDNWGVLRLAAGEAMVAAEYYTVTKDTSALELAKSQIDYILGDNPMGMSYIIGYGSYYPTHPHHRAANGYTYADNGNLKAAKNLLLGGLVGGPSTMGDYYADDAGDFTASEVGIDYNAGFVGAVAALMANGTYSNPSTSSSPVVTTSSSPVVTTTTPSAVVTTTPSPVVTTTTPSPVVTTTPSPVVTTTTPSPVVTTSTVVTGNVVPVVKVTTNGGSSINQSYTISSSGTEAVDLSKLTIRYNYTKSDSKAQTFTCDNAGLQLSVSPWYVNLSSDVKATFGNGYVDITFNTTQKIATGAGSLNMGCRIYNTDWSSYTNFVGGTVEVYYDGQLVG